MTINRQHTAEIEDATLDPFRTQIETPRDEARALVEQEGLNGLRIRATAKLYATEYLTSGEIPPAPENDEVSETTQREFSRRMEERLSRLRP